MAVWMSSSPSFTSNFPVAHSSYCVRVFGRFESDRMSGVDFVSVVRASRCRYKAIRGYFDNAATYLDHLEPLDDLVPLRLGDDAYRGHCRRELIGYIEP